MSSATRPLASLSLDLDNQWSYMKTHGDAGWEAFPTYLDRLVPRVLEVRARHRLPLTVFVVGQDAARPENADALRQLAEAGCEIGNHSFRHEPWLHLYTPQQVADELATAEEAILAATGQRPIGFRGPGFSLSAEVLAVLKRRGYRYDASTLPTFIGPLARAYYFMTARMSREERAQRKALFGGVKDVLRPLKPYEWDLPDGPLLEIPVTTMPLLRAPFHVSYLLYLAGKSPAAARVYFRLALRLCRLTGVEPSLLLHPLDFLGGDDIAALRFFPGMSDPAARKLAWLDGYLSDYARHFRVVTMRDHAAAVASRGPLRRRVPSLPGAPPTARVAAVQDAG